MKDSDVVTTRHRRYLLAAALLLTTFLIASIYLAALAQVATPPLRIVLQAPLVVLVIPMLFSPLFAGYAWFFGLLALTVVLAALALLRARPSRPVRLYLLGGILLLAAAPLLLPSLYGDYTVPVQAREEYEMLWLTEPQRPFASAFKQAQRTHEKHGCTYYLLGWTEDEVLYYRSACDGRLWAFDPATDHAPRSVAGRPPAFADSSVVGVNADGIGGYYPAHPAGFPPQAINHAITYQRAVSPQGRWVAAAIKNYYGPRDVVVLSRSPSGP